LDPRKRKTNAVNPSRNSDKSQIVPKTRKEKELQIALFKSRRRGNYQVKRPSHQKKRSVKEKDEEREREKLATKVLEIL